MEKARQTDEMDVDAWLRGQLTGATGADAWLQGRLMGATGANAWLRSRLTGAYGADAWLRGLLTSIKGTDVWLAELWLAKLQLATHGSAMWRLVSHFLSFSSIFQLLLSFAFEVQFRHLVSHYDRLNVLYILAYSSFYLDFI